jgi:hypothetical protein
VYLTLAHVTTACGLSAWRRRFRWTLDAVPVAGPLARHSVLLTERHRVRRTKSPTRPAWACCARSTIGWSVTVRP